MRRLKSRTSSYVYVWLFIVFLFGLPILTSYVFVQQEARSGIELPLIQGMQVIKAELQRGVDPKTILQPQEVDLSTLQSPFITFYSNDKKLIGSSAHLGNRTLTLPRGVLDISKAEGEYRVTWQPTSNLRFASITDYMPAYGYVSVAVSLREVESRAGKNLLLALLALGIGSLASGLGILIYVKFWGGNPS